MSKRVRTRINYPSKIKVDEVRNETTGKMEPVWISTGPFRKEICGDTQKSVNYYLAHLVERYRLEKAKRIKEKQDEIQNSDPGE